MEYLAALLIPALWVLIYFKRRNRKIDIAPQDEVVMGTDREREEAEKLLSEIPANIREHYANSHELIERYSTRHGYTAFYVEEIAKKLRDEGLNCDVVFQPGALPGVADSFLEQQGHYELWVANEDVAKARLLLSNMALS